MAAKKDKGSCSAEDLGTAGLASGVAMGSQTPPAERAQQYFEAARALLAELATAGMAVSSVGALLSNGKYPSAAVEILCGWLPRVEYRGLREDIVRTLSVPWARAAGPVLVAELDRASANDSEGVRWAIGNGLEVLASEEIADDMLRIASDRRYGKARQMVVLGLGKLKDPRTVDVLVKLLSDTDVAGQAITALGKLRAVEAKTRLEPFLEHETTWIRNAAKTALRRIAAAEH